MQQDDVKAYLKDNPKFFEENASFLAEISLPSPHGNGTISLAERQQLAQRDKIDALKSNFAELVLNARDNDAITNKIHALNIELHKAKNFDAIEQIISASLPEIFDLSETCMRIWASPLDSRNRANLVFSHVTEQTKTWVAALTQPYCGKLPDIAADDWFIEAAASIVLIPLRDHQLTNAHNIGFLALASEDKNRFYTDMGTDFLNKIGELLSAALSRHLDLS
jgi:uncharacterized protein YigA (DUF484 family)